jgi:hypothetical protein
MKPSLQQPRTPSRLSDSVHHQLNMYALAATAAGVGALALAQAAHAEIVYTHAHRVINPGDSYKLDLNHDRKIDFVFQNYKHTTTGVDLIQDYLWAIAQGNNGVDHNPGRLGFASALTKGTPINSGMNFGTDKVTVELAMGGGDNTWTCMGYWENTRDRYLGLEFDIKGRVHYGWARLNVKCTAWPDVIINATLTGYAYETIPGKAIIAGKAKGADVITVQPASLGHLAQGAAAILDRRQTGGVQ